MLEDLSKIISTKQSKKKKPVEPRWIRKRRGVTSIQSDVFWEGGLDEILTTGLLNLVAMRVERSLIHSLN